MLSKLLCLAALWNWALEYYIIGEPGLWLAKRLVMHLPFATSHQLHHFWQPLNFFLCSHIDRTWIIKSSPPPNSEFILLENLTWQFQSPCILDVKLGTRTYHKDHSEAKRKLHIDRDAATTTATLGLRICGMQVRNYPMLSLQIVKSNWAGKLLKKVILSK